MKKYIKYNRDSFVKLWAVNVFLRVEGFVFVFF